MYLCYIDESGTPDIPGNSAHYVLAGLAVPDEEWKKYEFEIQNIKKKYSLENSEIHTGWIIRKYIEQFKIPNFETLPYNQRKFEVEKIRNVELLSLQKSKNSKLYKQTKKNFIKTSSYIHLTYKERIEFITEIAQVISEWSNVRLFAECIDKIYFNPSITSSTVDEQAFEQIISRFEQYLQIYSQTKKVTIYGLLIHDNNETVARKHTLLMKKFHKIGTFWTKIQNIIETPLFVNSELTGMIQLADVCCYVLRRYLENNEDKLFKLIFKRGDRKNGKCVGIRHFTKSDCSCLICSSH